MHGLLKMRVRPYYLYQCDPISGSEHLRTPVEDGLEIIAGLQGHTTGYAVPTFVVDGPGGGGKIPLLPRHDRGPRRRLPAAAELRGRGDAPTPTRCRAATTTSASCGSASPTTCATTTARSASRTRRLAEFDFAGTIDAIDGRAPRRSATRPSASATCARWRGGSPTARAGTSSSTPPRACAASAARRRCPRCSRPSRSPTPSPTRSSLGAHAAQGHGEARAARRGRADRALPRGRRRGRAGARVELPFPLFVKPVAEGTAKGIDAGSRVTEPRRARRALPPACSGEVRAARAGRALPARAASSRWACSATGASARAIGTLELKLRASAEPGVYSYLNKEHSEERVDLPLADAAAAARGRAGRARRLARARRARRRPHRPAPRRRTAARMVLELNPLPGLHPTHSDLPILWSALGRPYEALIARDRRRRPRRGAPSARRGPTRRAAGRQRAALASPLGMKVAIVHDRIAADARVDERDALIQAEIVARAARRARPRRACGSRPAPTSSALGRRLRAERARPGREPGREPRRHRRAHPLGAALARVARPPLHGRRQRGDPRHLEQARGEAPPARRGPADAGLGRARRAGARRRSGAGS